MDECWLRESLAEWIATVGKGTRTVRRLGEGAAVVATALAIVAWLSGRWALLAAAAPPALLAVSAFVSIARRRSQWLRHMRTLPWFGEELRIVVRDGDLVQVKEWDGLPGFERTGQVVVTPNGYLVRYRGSYDPPNAAISDCTASIYVPHRAIAPPLSREEFRSRVPKLEFVG